MESHESSNKHLHMLELQLLQPEVRRSSSELGRLLHRDFLEFGSSGKIWNKEQTITALVAENSDEVFSIHKLRMQNLSDNAVLVTYKCVAEARKCIALRSSVWRHDGDLWKLFFHQGTLAQDESTT